MKSKLLPLFCCVAYFFKRRFFNGVKMNAMWGIFEGSEWGVKRR